MSWPSWQTSGPPPCQRPSPCSSLGSVDCPFLWTPEQHTKLSLYFSTVEGRCLGCVRSWEWVRKRSYLGLDDPVGLWFKGLYLVMAFHAEAESRGLARSKWNQGGIEVAIFALEILGLKTENTTTHTRFQVERWGRWGRNHLKNMMHFLKSFLRMSTKHRIIQTDCGSYWWNFVGGHIKLLCCAVSR